MTWLWVLLACTRPTPEIPEDSAPPSSEAFAPAVDPSPSDAPPDWGETADLLHVTVRTADTTFGGTDDPIRFCLGDDRCVSLDDPDWDDFGRDVLDVTAREGLGWSTADLPAPSLTNPGNNSWSPACLQVRLDGRPVHCRQLDDVSLDDATWTDPDGLALDCTTCEGAVLTHGPLLGAPDPDAVRLWYRTDATREVTLRLVPEGDDLTTAPVLATRWPRAERDFTDELVVRGLEPGRRYAWDLTIDDERFGPYSARTAPERAAGQVTRIAFGSCTKEDDQPIFEDILAWQPDLFLFVGDAHYGNTADLNAARHWWRWGHGRAHRRDLHARVPTLFVWDDHDFVDNNSDGTFPGIPTARRVVMEYTANPVYGADGEGIYSVHRHGDVDIFLVDTRTWRNVDGFIGAAQRAWLEDGLRSSTATVKLVVTGSQVIGGLAGESWDDQPADRDRLLTWASEVDGVVVLSGDVHRSEFRLLQAPDGSRIPELTSSPLATWTSPCGLDEDRLACLSADNFVGLEIRTVGDERTIEASMKDEDGTVRETWSFWP